VKAFYTDHFVLPLPEGHRFPMIKYDLIKAQLLYEGVISEENLFEPQELSIENLATCHDVDYIKNVINIIAFHFWIAMLSPLN
jgi:acetoin utilization deacetylase AcuC-like enzyme